MEPESKFFHMVEPEPEIWVPIQPSYTNNTLFSVFWTKLFWSRGQKLQDVGAGTIKLVARSWTRSLKFEYRLHSPAFTCRNLKSYPKSRKTRGGFTHVEDHWFSVTRGYLRSICDHKPLRS